MNWSSITKLTRIIPSFLTLAHVPPSYLLPDRHHAASSPTGRCLHPAPVLLCHLLSDNTRFH
ncbi:hypothetical protein PVAP13_6KG214606 [Panicum virgatum]|uniref:Uncharacterized protein n=1 Tax=Panicum virgatum TaxID=38727 RepID=A0A8T0RBX3_PANVG|nr:hypothetical protein PVAP13_6KG214606 [Panicum virgatum]